MAMSMEPRPPQCLPWSSRTTGLTTVPGFERHARATVFDSVGPSIEHVRVGDDDDITAELFGGDQAGVGGGAVSAVVVETDQGEAEAVGRLTDDLVIEVRLEVVHDHDDHGVDSRQPGVVVLDQLV